MDPTKSRDIIKEKFKWRKVGRKKEETTGANTAETRLSISALWLAALFFGAFRAAREREERRVGVKGGGRGGVWPRERERENRYGTNVFCSLANVSSSLTQKA